MSKEIEGFTQGPSFRVHFIPGTNETVSHLLSDSPCLLCLCEDSVPREGRTMYVHDIDEATGTIAVNITPPAPGKEGTEK